MTDYVGVNEMKKTYVKPVMEGEAFVANEYIAACWTVSCEGKCQGMETVYDARKNEILKDSYEASYGGSGKKYIYTGEFAGVTAEDCEEFKKDTYPSWADKWWEKALWDYILVPWFGAEHKEVTHYHPLQITSGWDNHPNASV